MLKMATILICLSFVSSAFAGPNGNQSADAQAADSACSADAATAGCGNEKVGSGLLACIGTYRKSHKGWKPSDACQAAIGTLKNDNVAVNTSCTAEAATAGCGNEKVGTGLIKCIRVYQKGHKDFQISSGCSAALAKDTGKP